MSGTFFWLIVGGLAGLLVLGAATLFLLMAMGRLTLDLGWGRSLHPLGPITVRIVAPRDLVFDVIRAPYRGRSPAGSGITVLERGNDLVVASHRSKVHFYWARTVEAVRFEAPDRIAFRHLAGPVPHAEEEFVLREARGETDLEYRGEVGIDFFVLGRLAGRYWVRPQWERTVRAHLEEVKERAELRARRRAARDGRRRSRG